jgi:hypothetical protein
MTIDGSIVSMSGWCQLGYSIFEGNVVYRENSCISSMTDTEKILEVKRLWIELGNAGRDMWIQHAIRRMNRFI